MPNGVSKATRQLPRLHPFRLDTVLMACLHR
jgi:hypothetical protein